MRIRSIRPEFWTSEDITALDWETRLVFIGLWSYVDDNGVGRDVEKLIVADLFPLEDDPRETLMRVSTALGALSDHGLVVRYEVESKPYLFVPSWDTHQKVQHPNNQRYPRPTSTSSNPHSPLSASSRDPHETLGTGEGEKGRRGEGEKGVGAPPQTTERDRPNLSVVPPSSSATETPAKSSRRQVSRPLPDDFTVTAEMVTWSRGKGISDRDAKKQTELFCDNARSKDIRFADWTAGWRGWLNKAVEFGHIRTSASAASSGPAKHEWEMR